MLEEFTALADDIQNLAGNREIVYVPNPGNFGDGLIRYGTKRFLYDFKIPHNEVNIGYRGGRYALLRFLLSPNNFFFLYGGGGAWGKAYDFGMRNTKFLSHFTDHFLVLPSTFELGLSTSKGRFYRRDHGPSKETMPHSRFCHDMAFYLAHAPALYNAPADGPTGNLYRTDHESARSIKSLPSDNKDLSLLGDHMANGDEFLRIVASYSKIDTDRLHVSIAGGIAGTQVNLYCGNYFKIAEIYKASMVEYFGSRVQLLM